LFARFSERISNEEFKTLEAQIASRNATLIWYDRDREFEYWQIRLRGKSYAIAYEVAAEVIYEFLRPDVTMGQLKDKSWYREPDYVDHITGDWRKEQRLEREREREARAQEGESAPEPEKLAKGVSA
jgi:hypothetical protein